MRIIYRIAHWYHTYRLIMWCVGIATSIIIPFGSYGIHAITSYTRRQETLVDSPEYASDITIGNPLEWLTGLIGGYGWILGIIALIGILVILFNIVFQIVSFVTDRTELSGTDKQAEATERNRRRLDMEETVDDYGENAW